MDESTQTPSQLLPSLLIENPERRVHLLAQYYQMHHRRRRYDFVMNEEPKAKFFQDQLMARFPLTETSGNRVAIDLGCRGGALTCQLQRWASWVGVDIDPDALEQARNRGIEAAQMDIATSIPLKSESFDLVMMTEVLEHLPYPLITLTEIHRILKPGPQSLFLGSVPLDYHLRRRLAVLAGRRLEGDPTHIHSFSLKEVRNLLSHYFLSVELLPIRTPHLPWKWLPLELSAIDVFWVAQHPRPGVEMAEIKLHH
jgi:SAM-dependent methyltransferase